MGPGRKGKKEEGSVRRDGGDLKRGGAECAQVGPKQLGPEGGGAKR